MTSLAKWHKYNFAEKAGAISAGVSASIYHQRLDERTGDGYGFGAGLAAGTGLGLFALTADNLGPDFMIGASSAPLPGRVSFSGWFPLITAPFNLSFDLSYRYGIGLTGGAGIEYKPFAGFNLRTGSCNSSPLAFGFNLFGGDIAVDYSYIPPSAFGDKHIFSFIFTK